MQQNIAVIVVGMLATANDA